MPEVHVNNELTDNILTDDYKAQKIEELRKTIEGKYWALNNLFPTIIWVRIVSWSFLDAVEFKDSRVHKRCRNHEKD